LRQQLAAFKRTVTGLGFAGRIASYGSGLASVTHLSLAKDAPDGRPTELPELGRVIPIPEVGGLHHRYVQRAA
jgi:hypothetical protein